MKLSFSFKIESDELNKLVKFAKENLTEESWSKYLKEPNGELQQFSQSTKNTILVIFVAIGLLKLGFDEEKTLKILENLLEIDAKCFSPSNSRIH